MPVLPGFHIRRKQPAYAAFLGSSIFTRIKAPNETFEESIRHAFRENARAHPVATAIGALLRQRRIIV